MSQMGLSGRYKVRIREGERIVHERDWQPNLILDQGLDQIAAKRIADLFIYAACGTDNTPVKDTPTATATWNGTTVTASASTFANTDIGKLIVFAGAQQCYITGFTDSTHVTVDRANTIPTATSFVMYHTTQTQLFAEVFRTSNYSQNAGDNSTIRNGSTLSLQRTFIFPVETGAGHTYYELGFTNGPILGAPDLFARVTLTPGVPVSGPSGVNPGQQLEIVYQLILAFGPSAPAPPTAGITGLPRSYPIYLIAPTVAGFEITINGYVPFFQGDRIAISGTASGYDSPAGTYYDIATITQGVAQTLIDINGTSHGTIGPGTPSVGTLKGYINLSQIAQDYGVAIVGLSGITTINPGQVLSGEPSQLGQIWAADSPWNPSVPTGGSVPFSNYVTVPYTLGSYVGKSFKVTKSGTFLATQAFSFMALGLGVCDTQGNQVLRVDCGQRQSKLGGELLSLSFTQNWVRTFT